MSSSDNVLRGGAPRQRLSREDRYAQLVRTAWQVIGEEGTDALTLGRLAERSAVSKPVVYDHFPTRPALLAALYQDFDQRQAIIMDAAIAASEPTLAGRALVIAASYIECVREQGREIPGIIAALAGSPELASIKREYQASFIEKCRADLVPFTGGRPIGAPALWAMLGAAEALSEAAVTGDISIEQARDELFDTIIGLVERSAGNKPTTVER
jgi:AcrR family transcriptional regulator